MAAAGLIGLGWREVRAHQPWGSGCLEAGACPRDLIGLWKGIIGRVSSREGWHSSVLYGGLAGTPDVVQPCSCTSLSWLRRLLPGLPA